jgi:hypothetical protein
MDMQCGRRRHHDEEGNEIGDSHAEIGIDLYAPDLGHRLLVRLLQRLGPRLLFCFLHLLFCLPEEEIGADGRAQHGDDGDNAIAAETTCGMNMPRVTSTQERSTMKAVAT